MSRTGIQLPGFSVTQLLATFSAKARNGAPPWGRGEIDVDPRDYGATLDGIADDTAGVQAAIATGGRCVIPPGKVARIATGVTVGLRQHLHISAGAKLQRLVSDTDTSPVVWVNRNHGKVTGEGSIEALNACPNGILHFERTGGTCEWALAKDLHLLGPGKTVSRSIGLVLIGATTFQNKVAALIVSDVETGVYFGVGANANSVRDVQMFNIALYAYDLDGAIENRIEGGTVLSSPGVTVVNLRDAAQGNTVAVTAEPGGSSTGYSISADSLDNMLVGTYLNTTSRGADSGVRTTIVGRRHVKVADEFYIAGVQFDPTTLPATYAAKAVEANLTAETTRATAAELALQNLTNSTFTTGLNNAFAARTGRSREPRVAINKPAQSMVTSFQSGHGWTLTNGDAASDLNYTGDQGLGSQVANVVSKNDQTAALFKSPVFSSPLNMTGRVWKILVKITGVANLNDIRFYAGDSTLANARNINLIPTEVKGPDWVWIKDGDWTWLTFDSPLGSAIGTPDNTAIRALQFRLVSNTGTNVTLEVGAVASAPVSPLFPNGVISFSTDDARLTGLEVLRKRLDLYGWAGTAFVIRDNVAPSYDGAHATLQQLLDARNKSGWEIALHSDTQADHNAGFDTLTAAQVEANLQAEGDWLYANGLGVVEGFAWPLGASTPTVELAASRIAAYARGIYTAGLFTYETVPPANPMRVRAGGPGTLAAMKAQVDHAVANGLWVNFVFHELVPTPSGSLEASQPDAEALIDYIAGLTTKPAVLPMIDVIRKAQGAGLTEATVGGDLSGTLGAPTVAKVNGVTITNAPTTSGQVPVSAGSSSAAWATVPTSATSFFVSNRISAGESTIPRSLVTSTSASLGSSGQMLLTYFTADITETITKLGLYSGSAAAGATPTLVRAGVYSIDSSGNGTLVAAIANDTTIYAAASGLYSRSLTSSFSKVAGQRYAIGNLVVTAAAVPTLAGTSYTGHQGILNDAPRQTGILTGQTDLPASFTDAGLASTSKSLAYVTMLR